MTQSVQSFSPTHLLMPMGTEVGPPLLAMVSSDGKVCVLSRRGDLQEWKKEGETAICFETKNVRSLTPVASFGCIPAARLANLRKLAERYEHSWAKSVGVYESNFGPQAQGYGFEFLSAVVAVYDVFGVTLEHDDFSCLFRFSLHVWLSWRVEDDGAVMVIIQKWTGGHTLIKGTVSAAGDEAKGWPVRNGMEYPTIDHWVALLDFCDTFGLSEKLAVPAELSGVLEEARTKRSSMKKRR